MYTNRDQTAKAKCERFQNRVICSSFLCLSWLPVSTKCATAPPSYVLNLPKSPTPRRQTLSNQIKVLTFSPINLTRPNPTRPDPSPNLAEPSGPPHKKQKKKELPTWALGGGGGGEARLGVLPVDQLPDGLDVVGADVLVLEVVGVLLWCGGLVWV